MERRPSSWHCGRSRHSAVGLDLAENQTEAFFPPFLTRVYFYNLCYLTTLYVIRLKCVTFKIASLQVHSVFHRQDNL